MPIRLLWPISFKGTLNELWILSQFNVSSLVLIQNTLNLVSSETNRGFFSLSEFTCLRSDVQRPDHHPTTDSCSRLNPTKTFSPSFHKNATNFFFLNDWCSPDELDKLKRKLKISLFFSLFHKMLLQFFFHKFCYFFLLVWASGQFFCGVATKQRKATQRVPFFPPSPGFFSKFSRIRSAKNDFQPI